MEIQEKSCPKCHSKEHLSYWHTLLITFREWPLMLMFAGTVILFGGVLQMTEGTSLLFALLAIVPLAVRVFSKCGCSKCGIEFVEGDPSQSV